MHKEVETTQLAWWFWCFCHDNARVSSSQNSRFKTINVIRHLKGLWRSPLDGEVLAPTMTIDCLPSAAWALSASKWVAAHVPVPIATPSSESPPRTPPAAHQLWISQWGRGQGKPAGSRQRMTPGRGKEWNAAGKLKHFHCWPLMDRTAAATVWEVVTASAWIPISIFLHTWSQLVARKVSPSSFPRRLFLAEPSTDGVCPRVALAAIFTHHKKGTCPEPRANQECQNVLRCQAPSWQKESWAEFNSRKKFKKKSKHRFQLNGNNTLEFEFG